MTCKKLHVVHLVEGDLLPWIDVEWENEDITGFTILLHVRKPNGTRFSKPAVIDDANVGGAASAFFHFEWAAGDLCAGDSSAEIEIFDTLGRNETIQELILSVAKEIA